MTPLAATDKLFFERADAALDRAAAEAAVDRALAHSDDGAKASRSASMMAAFAAPALTHRLGSGCGQ
jgi:hypothetical protein